MSTDYEALAAAAEAGQLNIIPGTIKRGPEARAEAARVLMAATGATRPEDVIPLAVGRSSPWKWCSRLRGCRGLVPVRSAGSASPPCSSRSLAPWSGAHGTGRAVPGRDTGGLGRVNLSV